MLIGGQICTAVEVSEFGRLIAPFCQAEAAQLFAVSYMNCFLIPQYKRNFPGAETHNLIDVAE